jgi:glycerol-3-phosphate acyltransferase PlsY
MTRNPEATGSIRPWRLAVAGLVGLALTGAGATVALRRVGSDSLSGPGFTLRVASQARTGHQRAERLAFADGGRVLAVICPRYNRLMLFDVEGCERLKVRRDVALDGRPVAVAAGPDRLLVVQRPAGDARHVEPAWWDAFDFEGNPKGERLRVGFDPDDLVMFDGGRTAVLLLSGRAEGEGNRPAPAAVVFDLSDPDRPARRGEVAFDQPGDDPERLVALADDTRGQPGPHAAVALRGSKAIAWLDLADPDRPRIAARDPFPGDSSPCALARSRDGCLWASDEAGSAAWMPRPGSMASNPYSRTEGINSCVEIEMPGRPGWLLALSERRSAVEVLEVPDRLGQVRLGGLVGVRPRDLAWLPQGPGRGALAVSDRSGGVYLLTLRADSPSR